MGMDSNKLARECKGLHPDHAAAPADAVSHWGPETFAQTARRIPRIGADDAAPIIAGMDLWDCWPLAHPDGRTATVNGRHYWFFLSAPQFADPVERHAHARIRLLSRRADGGAADWRDHGHALPDGLTPGTREWAGSAVLEDDGAAVTLYYTVAGRRGEAVPSCEQRLCATRGALTPDGIAGWTEPTELFTPDETRYVRPFGPLDGLPGTIKAFRDPFFFRDPATGLDHIVFTASAAWSADPHNGMVGLATRHADGWRLADPLVEAIGVNNELERAQVHVRAGQYYLFWSTQTHTFGPAAPAGPNGLYGMVADRLAGPWRPLNGSGLVAANPADEQAQSYSWVVTGEDEVWSFVELWGLAGRSPADHPQLRRSQFGGTPAPIFHLRFDGDTVTIA